GDHANGTTIAWDPARHGSRTATRGRSGRIQTAIEMAARTVSLEVRVSNSGAQRMYTRFGFRSVGVRKGYYQETGEDALVMWADDVHTEQYERLLEGIVDDAPEAR